MYVQVKGARHVLGIQKMLQQQASSSPQQQLPQQKAAEQQKSMPGSVASDESDAWTS